jgi:hypothetical protein
MVQWMGSEFGLPPMDAYQLLTQVSETPVANVCDPNYTVVCRVRSLAPRSSGDGRHPRPPQVDGAAYLAERR